MTASFVGALANQAGASGTTVSAPLPTHLAGDLLLVFADANVGVPVTPSGWTTVLGDSTDNTGGYFQLAPDTSTSHTLTYSATAWPDWCTAAYRGCEYASLVETSTDNISTAVSDASANMVVFFAVGAGGAIGTPSGLTKRASIEIGSLSCAIFDAVPSSGALPSYTFTNAVQVHTIALYPTDSQPFSSTEKAKLATLNSYGAKTLNAQTGTSYTLVLTDQGKFVTMTNAAASTLTVPPNSSVAYPVGTVIEGAQMGAGQVTITPGSGVTVSGVPGLNVSGQYGAFGLLKVGTDTWLAYGRLST